VTNEKLKNLLDEPLKNIIIDEPLNNEVFKIANLGSRQMT